MTEDTTATVPVEPTKPKLTSKKQKLLAAIEAAQKLVEQRKNALAAIDAREKSKQTRTPASTLNKQKFLLGAYVMETRPLLAKSDGFQDWLKRDKDRSVFGLEPLPPNA